MRPQQKSNRNRNKNKRQNLGNVTNRVFDSNGPEGKVRGTPQQIIDKYEALARDAQTSGDRVVAENFLQHAEHYARLLSAAQAEREQRRDPGDQPQPDAQFSGQQQGREDAAQPVVDPAQQEQPDLVVDTPEGAEAKQNSGGGGRSSNRRRSRPARSKPQGDGAHSGGEQTDAQAEAKPDPQPEAQAEPKPAAADAGDAQPAAPAPVAEAPAG